MNIAIILYILWELESSFGKNMNHKDGSLGHFGVKKDTITFVNSKLHTNYKPDDMKDYEKSRKFADAYIFMYRVSHPEATVRDIFAMWRCGWTGMHRPTAKQIAYIEKAVRKYEAEIKLVKELKNDLSIMRE